MILHGSIERFDLGSVLQFLAQNAATGILEIRDFEEHGYIYLVKGRLEAISLPLTDDRLGVHLIKTGVLSEGQLARVLMEEAGPEGGDGRKPLGQRLVEKGFTSEAIIREAMGRLIRARMFELAHWRHGVFTYDEPEEMPEFQIAIRGDVQELLLRDATAHRPRRAAAQDGERHAERSVLPVPGDRLLACDQAEVSQEGPLPLAQDERGAGRSQPSSGRTVIRSTLPWTRRASRLRRGPGCSSKTLGAAPACPAPRRNRSSRGPAAPRTAAAPCRWAA